MPRRYSPRASTPRRRIQKIRRDILAYSVPRQGVRHRRTPAQAAEEWRGAQAAMAHYNAQKQARRRAPVHARPQKKKRPWWSWLILDYKGLEREREIARLRKRYGHG